MTPLALGLDKLETATMNHLHEPLWLQENNTCIYSNQCEATCICAIKVMGFPNNWTGNDGCDGGFTADAFEYVWRNKGIDIFASYPYTERFYSLSSGQVSQPFLSIWLNAYYVFNTIFVSSHMYQENPEGTRVVVGSMNMGYDIYSTLQWIEFATCSVPCACRFH